MKKHRLVPINVSIREAADAKPAGLDSLDPLLATTKKSLSSLYDATSKIKFRAKPGLLSDLAKAESMLNQFGRGLENAKSESQQSVKEAKGDKKKPTQAVRDALVKMGLKADEQIDIYDQIIELLNELDTTFDSSKEEGELFVVYAHAGRSNGTAWIRAKNKAHAKQIAKTGGWLETGSVDAVETMEEYIATGMFEEGVDELPDLKLGEFEEIEWGT